MLTLRNLKPHPELKSYLISAQTLVQEARYFDAGAK
jgi:hypothetical protein